MIQNSAAGQNADVQARDAEDMDRAGGEKGLVSLGVEFLAEPQQYGGGQLGPPWIQVSLQRLIAVRANPTELPPEIPLGTGLDDGNAFGHFGRKATQHAIGAEPGGRIGRSRVLRSLGRRESAEAANAVAGLDVRRLAQHQQRRSAGDRLPRRRRCAAKPN